MNKKIYTIIDHLGIDEVVTKEDKTELLINKLLKSYNINRKQLFSNSRLRIIVEPRQIALFAMHKKYGYTSQGAADYFSKNHSNVLYASKNIEGIMQTDKDFNRLVNELI